VWDTNVKKPQPTTNEIYFDFNELFFSRTNERGVIEFGNDVFLRISGYPKEQMIGAPHSIVRHPDMPRAVFKLLWNTLQAGKPLVAYVKNMASNGNFYWVLAAAFPISGGYLSIRLRPSSPLFATVKDLYQKVLAEESVHGMEKAMTMLVDSIQQAGLGTYDKFMTTALLAELKARDATIGSEQGHHASGANDIRRVQIEESRLEEIKRVAADGANLFRQMFDELEKFDKASSIFQSALASVLDSFFGFQLVSLNMQVQAEKFGQSGATLTIISSDFQKLAQDIERHLKELSSAVDQLVEQMQVGTLNIALLKLQMDMVDFFVAESLSKNLQPGTESGSATDAFAPLEQNRDAYMELSSRSAVVARELVDGLKTRLDNFETSCSEIKRIVNGLEVISQMGAIESARVPELHEAFGFYIQKMSDFNEKLRTTSRNLTNETSSLSASVATISNRLGPAAEALGKIFDLALS
jgi:aerotaxis receptor